LDEETDSSDDTLPTEQMNIRLETGEVELTWHTKRSSFNSDRLLCPLRLISS
jgi:hypothetical protein